MIGKLTYKCAVDRKLIPKLFTKGEVLEKCQITEGIPKGSKLIDIKRSLFNDEIFYFIFEPPDIKTIEEIFCIYDTNPKQWGVV